MSVASTDPTADQFVDLVVGSASDRTALRRVWREGVRDIAPMVIGIVPMALAIGAAVGASTVPTLAGIASAAGILAGAAQLNTIEMLNAGASAPIIVLSGLMINARILLYSASIAPWFRDEPLRRRLLLAVPVIDQMHFTCIPRFERGDLNARERRWYYGGAATALVTTFVTTQVLVITASSSMPSGAHLQLAAPLALVGLLAKATGDRRATIAALVAGPLAVLGVGLPFHSSILVAVSAALVVDAFLPAEEATP